MITQQDVYDAYLDIGGSVLNQALFRQLKAHITLTEEELAPQWGHKHAFHNGVRSHITNLIQAGMIEYIDRGLHRAL